MRKFFFIGLLSCFLIGSLYVLVNQKNVQWFLLEKTLSYYLSNDYTIEIEQFDGNLFNDFSIQHIYITNQSRKIVLQNLN
ncbi:MAG: hypothetical protein HYS39_01130, partial [Proteobacteria bacterium]|nr:hypothetical protein [Pseudomonadota bacterium]